MDFAMLFFKEGKSKGINRTNKDKMSVCTVKKPVAALLKDKILLKKFRS